VIRIAFTDEDVARTRLALSPLWELAAALFTLHRTEVPAEHRAWAERTRAAMGEAGLGPLHPSVVYRHSCPDFMAPVPSDPLADVEDEIERVRATDPGVMAADIAECWPDGPPPPWDRFARAPREMADRLADDLHTFWRIALADDWPRLRSVLEGEVLGRARSLALAGPAAVLDEIHPRVRWRAPVLELHKGDGVPRNLDLQGRPLVLIPLVFEQSVLVGNPTAGNAIAVAYQARGAAALWERADDPGGGRAPRPASRTRSRGRAARPRTAGDDDRARRPPALRAEHRLRHLDVLARAGLVERHRVRRSVFYGLNATGSSLVALLTEIPAARSA
jgi:hypothetical protein